MRLPRIIYLIDRNILSTIKDGFAGRTTEEIKKIKSLDRKGVTISIMMMTIEGNKGRPQNLSEALKGIEDEDKYLPNFFKKAKVDFGFYNAFKFQASYAMFDQQPRDYERYAGLIQHMQESLWKKPKKEDRKLIRDEILAAAQKHGVERGNLVTICGLSALYGNKSAFDVLKPKMRSLKPEVTQKRIYNSLTDLMVIPRLQSINYHLKNYNPNTTAIFKTLDQGLENFIKQIEIKKFTTLRIPDGSLNQTTIEPKKKLFPLLNQIEYEQLMDLINTPNPAQ